MVWRRDEFVHGKYTATGQMKTVERLGAVSNYTLSCKQTRARNRWLTLLFM